MSNAGLEALYREADSTSVYVYNCYANPLAGCDCTLWWWPYRERDFPVVFRD